MYFPITDELFHYITNYPEEQDPIGYALVKYETKEEAQQAIHALNGKHQFGNKIVKIDWCFKEGPPSSSSSSTTLESDQHTELSSESSNDSSVLKRKRDNEWEESSEARPTTSQDESTNLKSEPITTEEISQQEQISQVEPPQKKNK